MPKRFRRGERPKNINQLAYQLVRDSTEEPTIDFQQVEPKIVSTSDISLVMAEMGRRGGKIGGKRRLETMTKAARHRAAVKAAKARWKEAKKSRAQQKAV